jgi:uncharacterized membrane protein YphA (DoxX/SURF4 family)
MRVPTNIIRYILGIVFIFSGLIKANDPIGLAYKMREFFVVWEQQSSILKSISLLDREFYLSIFLILLEVGLGVALIMGNYKRVVGSLILVLLVFFTFLTGYANFGGTNLITSCGCFGDCIPLTVNQSFSKDLILLVMALFIFAYWHYIKPLFTFKISIAIVAGSVVLTGLFMWYVLNHLPVKDCSAFATGTSIKQKLFGDAPLKNKGANTQNQTSVLRKDIFYIYSKAKDTLKIPQDEFVSADSKYGNIEDSGYNYVRIDTVEVKSKKQDKNNNVANYKFSDPKKQELIEAFTLRDQNANDVTTDILGDTINKHFILFINKTSPSYLSSDDKAALEAILAVNNKAKVHLCGIAVSNLQAMGKYNVVDILSVDDTVIKAITRTNTVLMVLDKGVIKAKYAATDVKKGIDKWLLK